jgi:phosphoribosylformylglycinamidine synthase
MNQNTKITPEIIEQHGLTQDEYQHILQVMGREPNITELGIFSVMWSEHCSYKSSRVYLKEMPTDGPNVLQGPGENAGIIDIGDGLAAAFKMESHNHPSFIEPTQGAATGVGGILRDIFTMGARPIANLNSLRFGATDHPKTPYLVRGVVSGIGGYGNTMGIPTVGGEVCFDPCYNGNILVNAFTLGVMKSDRIFRGLAKGIGNPVIYVGSKTGRDGIHGATMASDEFDEGSEERRPTVQVGDPFTEKLLMEACLELMATDAIVGIQDMGAAGLTCSSFEMASRAGSGMELDLDLVPKREEGMTPYELMLSESQERMLLVAKAGREDEVRKIFEKWDLDVAVVGRVTEDGKVTVKFGGQTVSCIPVAPIVHEAPLYERPVKEPEKRKALNKFDPKSVSVPKDLNDVLYKLIKSPNLCWKGWVWEQYDHMVMTNTTVRPGSDAAMARVKGTTKGIAMSADCNGRYCYLDPYAGAALAVAEAARNISCSGAKPLSITDCLNFGNPEKPEIMWQFRQAVLGMSEACRKFETPITGGNVSFYNETTGEAIYPTPTVGMIGLLDDIDKQCAQWFRSDGDTIVLLGNFEPQLGASEYLAHIHKKVAGLPPVLHFDQELRAQKVCRIGIKRGLIHSAHDVSDGGLAVTLAECCMSRPEGLLGASVTLEREGRSDELLFGETAATIVVTVNPGDVDTMLTIAKEHGTPATVIGRVAGRLLAINDLVTVDLAELNRQWRGTISEIVE